MRGLVPRWFWTATLATTCGACRRPAPMSSNPEGFTANEAARVPVAAAAPVRELAVTGADERFPATMTSSCQLLARPGLPDSGIYMAVCLRRSASGPGQVQVANFDFDPQFRKFARRSVVSFATPGEGAHAVFAPFMDYEGTGGTPQPRAGYQAGTRLGVLDYHETGGRVISLPFGPLVVRPLLGVVSGEIDAFVVDKVGRQLGLVRFARAGGADPRLLWTERLGAPIESARAALSAPPGGSQRHAVLVGNVGRDAVMTLVDGGDGSRAPSLHSVTLPGLLAQATSEPGLHVDAQGRARASVLLESAVRGDGSVPISLAEATWEANRSGPRLEISVVCTLPVSPRAAAATYSVSPGNASRAWVIVKSNGEVQSSSPRGSSSLHGTPSLPLEPLATSASLVLLTLDPAGSPELEPI